VVSSIHALRPKYWIHSNWKFNRLKQIWGYLCLCPLSRRWGGGAVLGRIGRPLSLTRHGPHRRRQVQQFFYCCVCIAAVKILPSRCISTIKGSLLSRCLATIRGYTYRHTNWWEGLTKFAVEMDSGAMIHEHTKFHKDWFRHSKVERGNTQTYRQHCDRISLLSFFQNKESRLKTRKEVYEVLSHRNILERRAV
jgi:hypothetical protein